MLDRRFEGAVAVVTGGAQGIGLAVAHRLAREGAAVVIGDRQAEMACGVASEIEASGGRAVSVCVDLQEPHCGQLLVDRALQTYSRINLSALCAGITEMKNWLDITPEEWDRMMSVNLRGTLLCLQAVAKQMIKQGQGGSIVTLGSTSGHGPRPDAAHYGASKAGIIHLTRSAALALAPYQIRVNAISPGIVNTAMWRQVGSTRASLQGVEAARYEQMALSNVPLGRFAEPEEIAALAAFLLSSEASYVTGQIILQDGGYSLRVA